MESKVMCGYCKLSVQTKHIRLMPRHEGGAVPVCTSCAGEPKPAAVVRKNYECRVCKYKFIVTSEQLKHGLRLKCPYCENADRLARI